MPVTPDHGLSYPGPDDLPDGPGQIKQLALDTEAALQVLIPDTGVKTDLDVTASTNWTISAKQYRIIGKKMYLRLQIVYSGANITADGTGTGQAPGNIPDTVIATINDATKRPTIAAFGLYRSTVTSGASQIAADGRVSAVDAHTTSQIRTNDTVNVSMAYPIP